MLPRNRAAFVVISNIEPVDTRECLLVCQEGELLISGDEQQWMEFRKYMNASIINKGTKTMNYYFDTFFAFLCICTT
jgi:hypothetical protein